MIAEHTPAAATDAVVTLAAVTGKRYRIKRLHWSFDDTPAAAVELTLTDGTNTYSWFIVGTGPGQIDLDASFAPATEVEVTLPSGGGTSKNSLVVEYELVI